MEGEWRWLTGELFWLGDETGSAQNGLYENWNSGEPNDVEPGEDGAEFRSDGTWNDLFNSSTNPCYFVEYPGAFAPVPVGNFAMILLSLAIGVFGAAHLVRHRVPGKA